MPGGRSASASLCRRIDQDKCLAQKHGKFRNLYDLCLYKGDTLREHGDYEAALAEFDEVRAIKTSVILSASSEHSQMPCLTVTRLVNRKHGKLEACLAISCWSQPGLRESNRCGHIIVMWDPSSQSSVCGSLLDTRQVFIKHRPTLCANITIAVMLELATLTFFIVSVNVTANHEKD